MQFVVNAIGALFQGLKTYWDTVFGLLFMWLNHLWGMGEKATDRMYEWLEQFFWWSWEQSVIKLNEVLATVNLTLPSLPSFPTSQYYPYLAMANEWLPLSEGVTLVILYFATLVVYIPIRIIIRHLPVVGG